MRTRTGYLELIVCGLVWGSIGVVVKKLDVSAPVLVFFRLSLGTASIVAIWAARGRLHELKLRASHRLVVVSGVVLALHWIAFFEAYKRLSVASTILIVYVGPVLIAVAAPFVLDERLQRRTLYALGLSVAGIALIARPSGASGHALGYVMAGVAAVLFAVLVLMLKKAAPGNAPQAVVVWELGIAAVVVAPWLAGASGHQIVHALPGLLALGVVHTGLIGILYVSALAQLPAQQVSILVYLEPVTAVLWAWAVLGEKPAAVTLVGGILILAAGLLIVVPGLREAIPPAALPEPVPRAAREAG